MAAFKVRLSIDQGATFRKHFVYKSGVPATAVDLTGFTARMQVREEVTSDAILVNLTTENGGITLGGTAGTIDLFINDTDTSGFLWTDGVYDLELVAPSGDVTRRISGTVGVSPEVTR